MVISCAAWLLGVLFDTAGVPNWDSTGGVCKPNGMALLTLLGMVISCVAWLLGALFDTAGAPNWDSAAGNDKMNKKQIG